MATSESFKTELDLSFISRTLPVGKDTWSLALNLSACDEQ